MSPPIETSRQNQRPLAKRLKGRNVFMTEPQIWTIIGALVAALGVLVTIVTQSFHHTMSSKFETLITSMNAQFDSVRAEMVLRFEEVDRRFEQIDARLGRLEDRVDGIVRVFPEPGE